MKLIYSSGTGSVSESPVAGVWHEESKHTVNVTAVNRLDDHAGRLAINLATNTVSSAENLLDGTLEILRERLVAHRAGNLDDLIEADGLVVLDVLLLLAVARGLLEGLDDKRGSSRDNGNGGLTVLDGELDSHAQAFLCLVLAVNRSRRDDPAYPV